MSKAEFTYKNSEGLNLTLILEIDLKTEVIQEFSFKGELAPLYSTELLEFKSQALNLTYADALKLKRGSKNTAASMSLWLLHHAIEDYLGSTTLIDSKNDLLCLCFGIGKSDLKKEILKRPDYQLSTLIAETRATSACGNCREKILKSMDDIRHESGLIFGLQHSDSAIDKDGHWVKIKGMYPAELLVKLDELKNIWMKREGIEDLFKIEIEKISGHHLWLSVSPSDDVDRNEKILSALSDFLKSETGVLFFLHLFI